uniref:PWI domain-containing protein n=1 Tax=Leersia perrieri TaxID=77586 RepID=A0A0D9VSE6_9ORYZ
MSGGFFRGTSADQDTRFSNKQAKLLKTQKFAAELEHLVDMTKVKMDVMKPWIATRVTELLGFEDEVLINFIYGLLEVKEADGKKIQIQLTGFMEKNTVKFMKELWSLLLSAQQNASGVPQQFLDAKEAEIQQKKAEENRIAQEIQKKREKDGRDQQLEKQKLMIVLMARKKKNWSLSIAQERRAGNPTGPGASPCHPVVGDDLFLPGGILHLLPGIPFLLTDSNGLQGVRFHLDVLFLHEGVLQEVPLQSPGEGHHILEDHPLYQDTDPRHLVVDIIFGGNLHLLGVADHHLPAIVDLQVVDQDHHLLDTPDLLGVDYLKTNTGLHLLEDVGHGPLHQADVGHGPLPQEGAGHGPLPQEDVGHGLHLPGGTGHGHGLQTVIPLSSPLSQVEVTKTPKEIPGFTQKSFCKPSTSPHNRSPIHSHRSSSRDIEKETNGIPSSNDVDLSQRTKERSRDDSRNGIEVSGHFSSDSERRKSTKFLNSPNKSERNPARDSSLKSTDKHLPSQDSTDTSGEENGSRARENARKANSSRRKNKDFSADLQLKKARDDLSPGEKSPARSQQSGKETRREQDSLEDERDGRRMKRTVDSPDDSLKQHSTSRVGMYNSYSKDGIYNEDATKGPHDDIATKYPASAKAVESESEDGSPFRKDKKKSNAHIDSGSSDSDESGKHRSRSEKRKHKRSRKHKRHHDDSSDESDSESDDKESKRRRKEEKKLRKEERRRRREERHRRRADRQASKLKLKHAETADIASDLEKDHESDSDADVRKKGSYTGREESDQQKLEIELREKALESLRAKKAINH